MTTTVNKESVGVERQIKNPVHVEAGMAPPVIPVSHSYNSCSEKTEDEKLLATNQVAPSSARPSEEHSGK